MKTQFKTGQVVRFKNYKRNEQEKEAYFVVIQEEDGTNELEIYTINSNRYYKSETKLIPIYPEEDLQIVDLRPSDLIDTQITIRENRFNEFVIGKVCFFNSDNHNVNFTRIGNTFVSDALFEFDGTCKDRLIGPLLIDLDSYK